MLRVVPAHGPCQRGHLHDGRCREVGLGQVSRPRRRRADAGGGGRGGRRRRRGGEGHGLGQGRDERLASVALVEERTEVLLEQSAGQLGPGGRGGRARVKMMMMMMRRGQIQEEEVGSMFAD